MKSKTKNRPHCIFHSVRPMRRPHNAPYHTVFFWTGLPLMLFLGGCQSREETLYTLGNVAFTVYLVALVITLNIKRFHEWPLFIKFAHHIRKTCLWFSILVAVIGVLVFVLGVYLFFIAGPTTEKLVVFLGTIILVLGRYLWLWAKTDTVDKKATFAKIITLSISFGVALLYLICGGSMP